MRETRPGIVLDAGAFIALERRDGRVVQLFRRALEERTPLVTSAGVVAQIWRGGAGAQVPVALALRRTRVVDLTHAVGRILGLVLGHAGAADPIDAHVVMLARERGWPVLTSDEADLRRIDPNLDIEAV